MTDNCIYSDDGEPFEVSTRKLRHARKPHQCTECGGEILPGDLYEHIAGLSDGEWCSYKTCARCCNVRDDFFVAWTYGTMVEDFQCEHGFDYRDGIPEDFTPCGKIEEPGE
ncbi:MAG: hypothetical protein IIB38_03625 [Candidatus Hydrogenedentes bacterium]|nr:hypothetical protein [Candidatus Hydrogenedentota bacterium]